MSGVRKDLAGVGIWARTAPGMQCAARPATLSKVQERVVNFVRDRPGATWRDVAMRYGYTAGTVLGAIAALKKRKVLEDRGEGQMHLVEAR